MTEIDDPEASYRRGYTHGAWDVIAAVRGLLSPHEQARLEAWFNESAREWRLKNLRGESQRLAGKIAVDIAPPRHLLRLS
jgi:hypothetical protein